MSEPHTHHSEPAPASSRHAKRLALAVIVPAALLTVVAMIWLWPPPVATPGQDLGGQLNVVGKVVAVHEVACPPVDPEIPPAFIPTICGTVDLTLADGPQAGTSVTTEIPSGPGAPVVAVGDTMVLLYLPDTTIGNPYQIVDHKRSTQLWWIGAAFVFAVVAFGRLRGLTALFGLAITFAVLLLFIIPAILDGSPPLLVAIVGAAAIMLAVLYLTHGFTVWTSVAVAGTLASLAVTGVLSATAVAITHLTGISDEQTTTLNIFYGSVNMQGLLLAGILIGALGVLDDVTVTQVATVAELGRANPHMGIRGLYRAATRVGRAHIAAVINTIILAYAGASMPLLILIAASDAKLGTVLSEQLIAQELVRGAIGTIGLITAVPITTLLAALAARHMNNSATTPAAPTPRPPLPPETDVDESSEALLNPRSARTPWPT